MASENKMTDGTSFHQSDMPVLCANGCGFFGTAATMNLCSKCLKEEQSAAAKAAVKSMTSISPSPVKTLQVEKPTEAASSAAEEPYSHQPAKAANRCESCNKKVGILGFKCKCGSTFCGSHRYPGEGHDCNFDYKGAGRNAIAKANPIVKADKIQRF